MQLRSKIFIGTLLALMVFVFVGVKYNKENFGDIRSVTDDWTNQDGSLVKNIDEDMLGKSLMFYTEDAKVFIYLDDDVVYQRGKTAWCSKSPGSWWNLYEIPAEEKLLGKELKITFTDSTKIQKLSIRMGSSGALMAGRLRSETLIIVLNVVLLVFGILSILLFYIEKKSNIEDTCDLHLGTLSVLSVIIAQCSLFSIQILYDSGLFRYFLYYFSFLLVPYALMFYVDSLLKLELSRLERFHIGLSGVMILLQVTGVRQFYQTFLWYMVVVVLEVACIAVKIIKNKVRLPRQTCYLLAGVLLAIVLLLCNYGREGSLLFTIFMIFYVGYTAYYSLMHLMVDLIELDKNDKLEEIAYRDSLTGLPNRYAFDRDIATIGIEYLSLVSLDLNNLKYYNDKLGHSYGDRLLKDAAEALKKVYSTSVYRTGGDEFIAIQAGVTTEEMLRHRDELMEYCKRFLDDEIILEIACGVSSYQEGDKSYEDIFTRADNEMYRHKKELKKNSKIKSVR